MNLAGSVELRSPGVLDCREGVLPLWWPGEQVPLYVGALAYGQNPDMQAIDASFRPFAGGEFPVLWRARDGSRYCALDLPRLISSYLSEEYVRASPPPLAALLPFDYNEFLPFWARKAAFQVLAKISGPLRGPNDFPPFPRAALVQVLEHIGVLVSVGPPKSASIRLDHPTAIVTHDVDSDWILKNDYWLDRFVAIDKDCGFRSCWFVVGEVLAANPGPVRKILDAGHELGIHGYTHRGNLGTAGRPQLEREFRKIRSLLGAYPIRGFRSPWMARSPLLFDILQAHFEFDSSVPEVEAQLGRAAGCLSCRPFSIGNLVELPITVPDESYRYFLRCSAEEYYRFLFDKVLFLKAAGGLINIVHHPFPHFGANEAMATQYERFLKRLSSDPGITKASPSELATACGRQVSK